MEQKTYSLQVAGLTRELPICPVDETLDIAAFVMFSDVELTIACATALLERVPEYDVLITAESKGIPLAYEMSRQSGKRYLLARKGIKLYMTDPVGVEVKSITTSKVQNLYLDVADKVSVQLQLTAPDLKSRDRVVKKSEKDSLYAAMDVACVWLERALSGK